MTEWVFLLSRQNKQSFLHGATILMVSMIIVKIIGAIFKIPITNIIDMSGMAYFGSAYTIFNTVYALTVTGLSAAVARMVAENVARERYRDVKKILKLATRVFLVLGILGFVIVVLCARGIANLSQNQNAFWSIVMVSPAIFFCCMMASYRGYYEGLSDMIPTAITQVIEVMVKLVAGLLFAWIVMGIAYKQYADTGIVFGMEVASKEAAKVVALPYGAAAAILGISLSTLVGFVYIYIRYKIKGDYITKEMVVNSPKSIRIKVLLKRLVRIAIPITLGAVVIQLSTLIDSITIPNRLEYAFGLDPNRFLSLYGDLLKPNEKMNIFIYGCFNTVIVIFSLVPAFTNIFGKSGLPNVTQAWTTKNKANIKLNVESVIRATMLIAAPASFGIAFLATPILQLVFRHTPSAAIVGGPVLSVLGIGALFLSLVTPLNAIMQGIGRMDLPVKYLSIGVILKFVLNVILIGIPSINIMGAGISTICCYGVIAFLSINKLRKIIGVKLDFLGIVIKPLLSGFICGFSAFLCYKALTLVKVNSIITMLSIGVGAIFYVISLALLNAISKDDVLMLPKGNKIAKTLEKYKIIR